MTPQEESAQIFADVVHSFRSSTHDVKSVLRSCQHACNLLNWHTQLEWFWRELNGYSADEDIPSHRKVRGTLTWQATGPDQITQRLQMVTRWRTIDLPEPDEVTEQEVRVGIDNLLILCQTGYSEVTGEVREVASPRRDRTVIWERMKIFPATAFASVVREIKGVTFDFASRSYSLLQYGNVLTDFWTDYRTQVDAALQRLNFSNHLDAIQTGFQSANPESWRSAVLACRNLLNDLANHLWRDSRETYQHLKGDGQGLKLKVTEDRYANRLSAYIHQKGLRGTTGGFIRGEIERLAVSIRALIALQSRAHLPITGEDARTVALATYFILGELVIKTDMQPIERYGAPAAPVVE